MTTISTIAISDRAKTELTGLEVSRDNFLRIWAEAGGCSGMTYQAAIDQEYSSEDTTLYEDENLRVVSDRMSAPLFAGLQIDYSDDLVAPGFRFYNPNATRTCGCGSSFSCEAGA